jgi:hypothetical protein
MIWERKSPNKKPVKSETTGLNGRVLCYSLFMAVKSIQLGQVWRNNENGNNFLVTKVYNELFTQYAMLRPADVTAPNAESIRVKVSKNEDGVTLPGYTFTQDLQEF